MANGARLDRVPFHPDDLLQAAGALLCYLHLEEVFTPEQARDPLACAIQVLVAATERRRKLDRVRVRIAEQYSGA
jgi:hypothetical protein